MSFENLKQDELIGVAEAFGVELQPESKKPAIIAALAEEGVTWDAYQMFSSAQSENDEEVEPIEDSVVLPKKTGRKPRRLDDILLKMNRQNFHFEIYGKVFTKEHPFALCTPDEAQAILDAEDGFTIASPREAAEYYS